MSGWVLKMRLMLSQLSTKLELKLKLKLSLATSFFPVGIPIFDKTWRGRVSQNILSKIEALYFV